MDVNIAMEEYLQQLLIKYVVGTPKFIMQI